MEHAMPHLPRFRIGPPPQLPSDLEELGRRLRELPDSDRKTLAPLYDRVVEGYRLRARITDIAKEALERIRLEVAFLQFDLDATRKEKESLQKQLDEG